MKLNFPIAIIDLQFWAQNLNSWSENSWEVSYFVYTIMLNCGPEEVNIKRLSALLEQANLGANKKHTKKV
jgi:hypothetical protein